MTSLPSDLVCPETRHAGPMGRRFVILGLPRSGTTYLTTLLNSHRQIYCAGELFNPYAIFTPEKTMHGAAQITARDADPATFLDDFFQQQPKVARIGFKLTIPQNAQALAALACMDDLSIIYVHRANRLAQAASLAKARWTKQWAQKSTSPEMAQKISPDPRWLAQLCHEAEAQDFLAKHWLSTQVHRYTSVEYRTLFTPDFGHQICDFLGLEADHKMASPLIKQGSNQVLARFENHEAVAHHFRTLGKAEWLGPELA